MTHVSTKIPASAPGNSKSDQEKIQQLHEAESKLIEITEQFEEVEIAKDAQISDLIKQTADLQS
jgi:hypothetical protein